MLSAQNIPKFDWQVHSVNDIEAIQPHLIDGIKLSEVLEQLGQKSFNEVIDNLVAQTNKSFGDSFLYPKHEEIYERLGILEQIKTRNYQP